MSLVRCLPPERPERPQLRIIRLEPPTQPDWRIVGEHDPALAAELEVACS
jgi:hypothetical protein